MSSQPLARQEFRKHVAAIHTSGELTLLERKIVNVLLLNAYDDLITKRAHTISVLHLSEMLGWDASHNIERLQFALRRIIGTTIEFNLMEDGAEVWEITSLLAYAKIKDGVCTYKYVEELAERLFDPEVYANINIGVQKRFKGGYSLTLYENCLRYKAVGSTGWWDIPKFRRIMGADAPMYDQFKRLSCFVISKAVDEINRQSDINITPEYRKAGCKVEAVRFIIREHAQLPLTTPESLDGNGAVRETDAYKRLREHGIGDKLAIAWILQDEERAKAVVDYVEERNRKRQVKGSTAGYIRTLYESAAEVGQPAFAEKQTREARAEADARKRKAAEKRRKEYEAEFVRERAAEAVQALTIDARRELLRKYLEASENGKERPYDANTAEFRDALERLQFAAWLRKRLAPSVNTAEFKAWLKARQQSQSH